MTGHNRRCHLPSCAQLFTGADSARYCSIECRKAARKQRFADISIGPETLGKLRVAAADAHLSMDVLAERIILLALDIAEHGPSYIPPPIADRVCARPDCGRTLPTWAKASRLYCNIACSRRVHADREIQRYHRHEAARKASGKAAVTR